MLLARRKRKAIRALSVGIDRFAHQPSRYLPDVFLVRRDNSRIRAAITWRDREALKLTDDDIRLARRLDQTERYGFGQHHHQQRALALDQRGDFFYLFEQAKTIERLDN